MKKHLLIVLLSAIGVLFSNKAKAQCGYDDLCAADPVWMQQLKAMTQPKRVPIFNARIAGGPCQTLPGDTAVFPVVVHVIYTNPTVGSADNPTDAAINQMIADANDYLRNKAGFAPDTKIRLALAKRTVNGTATTAIIRVDGRSVADYQQNGVKLTTTGAGAYYADVQALSNWSSNHAVNIWLVRDIVGNLGGFESGSYITANEGMTVNTKYLSQAGLSLAHEFGHYLGLSHTFAGQVGNTCSLNDDCVTQGDFVCDTPPHLVSDQGTTSSCVAGDATASTQNVMSYGATCNRFTPGQTDRMWNSIYSPMRWDVVTRSTALIPASTSLELGILSIQNNSFEYVCGKFVPIITLGNAGMGNVSSSKVETYVDGMLVSTTVLNRFLAAGTSDTFSLKGIDVAYGVHTFEFKIVQFNASGTDYSSLNNSICGEIELVQPAFRVQVGAMNGTVSGAGTGDYPCDSLLTFAIIPDSGYEFVKWTTNGSDTVSLDSVFHLRVHNDINFYAECKRIVPTGVVSSLSKFSRIYPVPAFDQLNVDVVSKNDEYTIKVFDMLGNILSPNIQKSGHHLVIDLHDMTSGYYFLYLEDSSGYISEKFLLLAQ